MAQFDCVNSRFFPVRDGVRRNLVALVVQLVDHGVVGVLVGDVEGGVDGASVWVLLALGPNSIVLKKGPKGPKKSPKSQIEKDICVSCRVARFSGCCHRPR